MRNNAVIVLTNNLLIRIYGMKNNYDFLTGKTILKLLHLAA